MIGAYLKERVKHAVRFRHKRGFGVHSPFMFNFILNVIRDRQHQFAYPEMAERLKTGRRERKFFRLLFRLAIFLKVRHILCCASKTGGVRVYLQCLDNVECIEWNESHCWESADMIFIGRDCRNVLMGKEAVLTENIGKNKQCIVISDIHKNSFNASLWRSWAMKANVRIDMMWYGILLFDDKLQRGKYNLIL